MKRMALFALHLEDPFVFFGKLTSLGGRLPLQVSAAIYVGSESGACGWKLIKTNLLWCTSGQMLRLCHRTQREGGAQARPWVLGRLSQALLCLRPGPVAGATVSLTCVVLRHKIRNSQCFQESSKCHLRKSCTGSWHNFFLNWKWW